MTIYDMIDHQYNVEYGHKRLDLYLAGFEHTVFEQWTNDYAHLDLVAHVVHNDKKYYFYIRTDELGMPQHCNDWDDAIKECIENMKKTLEEQTWL